MIQIRSAVRNDVPAILQFIKDLAEFEKLAHDVSADEATLQKSLFEKKSAEVLMAEENQVLVGFAVFFHNFSTFKGRHGLYLEDLFVKPQYRKSGTGKLLLQKLAEIALERGCARMEWAALDWNENAITFYKKLGAIPMSEWTVFRLGEKEMMELAKSNLFGKIS